MSKGFFNMNKEELLVAENEYMKMKLMLENGPEVVGWNFTGLNTQEENHFLRNIIEYEQLFDKSRLIKIFDKIGKPTHFKPPSGIPPDEIDNAWDELKLHMRKHMISLDVCSPNITRKELYRCAVEELFNYEIGDVNMPGLMCCFVYDDFYPDLLYENSITATDHCISYILAKAPMDWMFDFKEKDLRLNEHRSLTITQLKRITDKFKEAYDDLEIIEIRSTDCSIQDNQCKVRGIYSVMAKIGQEPHQLAGNWEVLLSPDAKDTFYWTVNEVDIEGIRF
jgi:hypothetical protein